MTTTNSKDNAVKVLILSGHHRIIQIINAQVVLTLNRKVLKTNKSSISSKISKIELKELDNQKKDKVKSQKYQ